MSINEINFFKKPQNQHSCDQTSSGFNHSTLCLRQDVPICGHICGCQLPQNIHNKQSKQWISYCSCNENTLQSLKLLKGDYVKHIEKNFETRKISPDQSDKTCDECLIYGQKQFANPQIIPSLKYRNDSPQNLSYNYFCQKHQTFYFNDVSSIWQPKTQTTRKFYKIHLHGLAPETLKEQPSSYIKMTEMQIFNALKYKLMPILHMMANFDIILIDRVIDENTIKKNQPRLHNHLRRTLWREFKRNAPKINWENPSTSEKMTQFLTLASPETKGKYMQMLTEAEFTKMADNWSDTILSEADLNSKFIDQITLDQIEEEITTMQTLLQTEDYTYKSTLKPLNRFWSALKLLYNQNQISSHDIGLMILSIETSILPLLIKSFENKISLPNLQKEIAKHCAKLRQNKTVEYKPPTSPEKILRRKQASRKLKPEPEIEDLTPKKIKAATIIQHTFRKFHKKEKSNSTIDLNEDIKEKESSYNPDKIISEHICEDFTPRLTGFCNICDPVCDHGCHIKGKTHERQQMMPSRKSIPWEDYHAADLLKSKSYAAASNHVWPIILSSYDKIERENPEQYYEDGIQYWTKPEPKQIFCPACQPCPLTPGCIITRCCRPHDEEKSPSENINQDIDNLDQVLKHQIHHQDPNCIGIITGTSSTDGPFCINCNRRYIDERTDCGILIKLTKQKNISIRSRLDVALGCDFCGKSQNTFQNSYKQNICQKCAHFKVQNKCNCICPDYGISHIFKNKICKCGKRESTPEIQFYEILSLIEYAGRPEDLLNLLNQHPELLEIDNIKSIVDKFPKESTSQCYKCKEFSVIQEVFSINQQIFNSTSSTSTCLKCYLEPNPSHVEPSYTPDLFPKIKVPKGKGTIYTCKSCNFIEVSKQNHTCEYCLEMEQLETASKNTYAAKSAPINPPKIVSTVQKKAPETIKIKNPKVCTECSKEFSFEIKNEGNKKYANPLENIFLCNQTCYLSWFNKKYIKCTQCLNHFEDTVDMKEKIHPKPNINLCSPDCYNKWSTIQTYTWICVMCSLPIADNITGEGIYRPSCSNCLTNYFEWNNKHEPPLTNEQKHSIMVDIKEKRRDNITREKELKKKAEILLNTPPPNTISTISPTGQITSSQSVPIQPSSKPIDLSQKNFPSLNDSQSNNSENETLPTRSSSSLWSNVKDSKIFKNVVTPIKHFTNILSSKNEGKETPILSEPQNTPSKPSSSTSSNPIKKIKTPKGLTISNVIKITEETKKVNPVSEETFNENLPERNIEDRKVSSFDIDSAVSSVTKSIDPKYCNQLPLEAITEILKETENPFSDLFNLPKVSNLHLPELHSKTSISSGKCEHKADSVHHSIKNIKWKHHICHHCYEETNYARVKCGRMHYLDGTPIPQAKKMPTKQDKQKEKTMMVELESDLKYQLTCNLYNLRLVLPTLHEHWQGLNGRQMKQTEYEPVEVNWETTHIKVPYVQELLIQSSIAYTIIGQIKQTKKSQFDRTQFNQFLAKLFYIKGPWGCGKSYQIRRFCSPKDLIVVSTRKLLLEYYLKIMALNNIPTPFTENTDVDDMSQYKLLRKSIAEYHKQGKLPWITTFQMGSIALPASGAFVWIDECHLNMLAYSYLIHQRAQKLGVKIGAFNYLGDEQQIAAVDFNKILERGQTLTILADILKHIHESHKHLLNITFRNPADAVHFMVNSFNYPVSMRSATGKTRSIEVFQGMPKCNCSPVKETCEKCKTFAPPYQQICHKQENKAILNQFRKENVQTNTSHEAQGTERSIIVFHEYGFSPSAAHDVVAFTRHKDKLVILAKNQTRQCIKNALKYPKIPLKEIEAFMIDPKLAPKWPGFEEWNRMPKDANENAFIDEIDITSSWQKTIKGKVVEFKAGTKARCTCSGNWASKVAVYKHDPRHCHYAIISAKRGLDKENNPRLYSFEDGHDALFDEIQREEPIEKFNCKVCDLVMTKNDNYSLCDKYIKDSPDNRVCKPCDKERNDRAREQQWINANKCPSCTHTIHESQPFKTPQETYPCNADHGFTQCSCTHNWHKLLYDDNVKRGRSVQATRFNVDLSGTTAAMTSSWMAPDKW